MNKQVKEKKSVDALYLAFKKQRAKDRAGTGITDPAVLAGIAATVGPDDHLIVIKPFKASGVLYKLGDQYKPDADDRDLMVSMMRNGYLLTAALYKKSESYHRNKDQAQQVERLYLERQQQQGEMARAKNAVEILQADLDQARDRLAAAETTIQNVEAKLLEILG